MATSSLQTSTQQTQSAPFRPKLLLRLGELLIWIFLVGMALVEFAPISWIFATSLRNPSESFNLPPDFWPTSFRWDNYLAVIQSPQINFLLFFGTASRSRCSPPSPSC